MWPRGWKPSSQCGDAAVASVGCGVDFVATQAAMRRRVGGCRRLSGDEAGRVEGQGAAGGELGEIAM